MRIHYIQHVPFEGLGYIDTWLNGHAHTITATKVWEQPVYPDPDDFDGLIIMGGPMGVYDDHIYPWLKEERFCIQQALQQHKKVIGVCLGAQLIAAVLGATVFSNRNKEIGWFPVKFEQSFSKWLGKEAPSSLQLFHWHGDKFDIPYGAVLHAGSEACSHQVFTIDDNVVAVQFHLEATPNTVADMLQYCKEDITAGAYVQSAEIISRETNFQAPNELMGKILDRLFG